MNALLNAIKNENGRKMEGFSIRVNPAKYDKQAPPHKPPFPSYKPSHKPPYPKIPTNYDPALRDHRLYRDVSKPQQNQKENTAPPTNPPSFNNNMKPNQDINASPPPLESIIPNQILEPLSCEIAREMTNHRKMSSRVLGEDTELVRDQVEQVELQGDQILAITGEKNPEMIESLKKSVIAVANSPSSSRIIHGHILAEGFNGLKIKPLGGLLHLIQFESVEEKEEMVKSKWLDKWFLEVRDVNNSSTSIWREIWITIYGVPLVAWSYENFRKIGCIYGKVISVDYARMDYARVQVFTDCLFKVNNPIVLYVEGKLFKVFVTKDFGLGPNHDPPAREDVSVEGRVKDDNWDDDDWDSTEEDAPFPKNPSVSDLKPMNVSPGILGDDNNNGTIITSPIKTLDIASPTANQKPPKYSKPPKTQLNFNSPLRSPSHLSMGNLNHHEPPLQLKEPQKYLSPPSQKSSLPLTTNLGSSLSPNHIKLNSSPDLSLRYFNPPIIRNSSISPIALKPSQNTQCSPSPKISNSPTKPSCSAQSFPYNNPQVLTSNTFNPLIRKSQAQSQLGSFLSSPSTSSPSIPPCFEDFIPPPLKAQHEQRRLQKRLKKKFKKRFSSTSSSNPPLPPSPYPNPKKSHENTASEIIELGLQLGMNFSGELSELQEKIVGILSRQEHDWLSNV